ncbi:hypothetical protein MCOR31_011187 [Pyricularia oryzae]|nr:hypothetical protein MCOR31_011187 [Pyricularia oryzae]KAI6500961.1 hypothetical protein MCOR11_002424 [Pyricularia oryzae]KAI6523783.1 hypothetical protein MCOR16_007104 [Pyricularia oryzae]KAI6526461.1 hypothetical protein MCOR10_004455 [Pyricularia oryzae]KAI6543931.1 hypothetical protein MCOR05_002800 [Pyricularia oryzae]
MDRRLGLHQVFPDPNNKDGIDEAEIDIIAVHGLGRDPESAWIAWKDPHNPSSGNVHWLRDPDMLPAKVIKQANCRILTYNWNSVFEGLGRAGDSFKSGAITLLSRVYMDRKKQALMEADSKQAEPADRDIIESTVGIIFLGTPFAGVNIAATIAVQVRIQAALSEGEGYSDELLRYIESTSTGLDELVQNFARMHLKNKTFDVVSFYETLPSNFKNSFANLNEAAQKVFNNVALVDLVVNEQSARFPNPALRSIALVADHKMIMKFNSPDDPNFQTVCFYMEELIETAKKKSQFAGAAADRLFTTVHDHCQSAAIFGLGGIGKTQLALELAYLAKSQHSQKSIFWVQASSKETFEQSYRQIARALQIPDEIVREDPRKAVLENLGSDAAVPWLMVVDNADDESILFPQPNSPGLFHCLPWNSRGLMVFTTRVRDVANRVARSCTIDLREMDSSEALDLFKRSVTGSAQSRDDSVMATLLEKLDYIPLAISQAAAYIDRNKTPLRTYLNIFTRREEDMAKLMHREYIDETDYRGSLPKAVATTWHVSFDKIYVSDQDAARLLRFISFIEPKGIPRSILPHAEDESTEYAIGTLCGYAFLAQRTDVDPPMFDMHSLVHWAARNWIKQEDPLSWPSANEQALRHLKEVFPRGNWDERSKWGEYFPHTFRALECGKPFGGSDERALLCQYVGVCLKVDGRINEAICYHNEALRWWQSTQPEDHSSRLALEDALAEAYLASGQRTNIKKAVDLLEKNASWRERLADDDPDRRLAQYRLAKAYLKDGQKSLVQKAIELLQDLDAFGRRTLADSNSRRQQTETLLAQALTMSDRASHNRTAIEMLENSKGSPRSNDLDQRSFEFALANSYLASDNPHKVHMAVVILEDGLAFWQGTSGLRKAYRNRLVWQNALAGAYLIRDTAGDLEKATELLQKVVSICERSLANNHITRLNAEQLLQNAQKKAGLLPEADLGVSSSVNITRRYGAAFNAPP